MESPVSFIAMFVYVGWVLSEMTLARYSFFYMKNLTRTDTTSLIILWVNIIIGISAAWYFNIMGYGVIQANRTFIIFLGIILIIAGVMIRWISVLTLRRVVTENKNEKTVLVTEGIYGIIRHPSYTGALISFFGLGLTFANWISTFFLFIPVAIAFLYRINLEEKILIRDFGDKYLEYSKRTKSIIPGVF
jgi:protein-S-isoprenylcysteine O-methyltransferase Ste14